MFGSSYMFRHYIAILHESTKCLLRDAQSYRLILQLSVSQKALGTLPEDGNVMPKHVGDTIRN
jgi:hypothetical protein